MFSRSSKLVRITSLAAVVALAAPTPTALAGVEGDMTSFFRNLGGLANTTGAQAHKGQESGLYTGGNIFMRTPAKTTQLAAVSMPGFRGGCGGIDMFGGAFSFVNAGELVQMMKSIASSAVGFSFKLALETISPVIGNTISELNDLAQRINQANINSCETATALLGSVWPRTDQTSKTICEQLGNSSGIFSDYAYAKQECGAGGQRSGTLSNASGAVQNQIPINKNLTWEAMKTNGLFASMSDEEKQLWMTLAGTVIFRNAGDDNSPNIVQTIPSELTNNGLLASLLGSDSTAPTVSLVVDRCDETDKCLQVTPRGLTITLDPANSFYGKIKRIMTDMVGKIKNNTALSEEDIGLLNLTAMPFYKMITVYTAYNAQQALSEIPSMSQLVALDMLAAWINEGLNQVEKGAHILQFVDKQQLDAWRAEIRRGRELVEKKRDDAERTQVQRAALIEKTRIIENILASNFSANVGGAYGFAKALRRSY